MCKYGLTFPPTKKLLNNMAFEEKRVMGLWSRDKSSLKGAVPNFKGEETSVIFFSRVLI